jgi:plastocyanin
VLAQDMPAVSITDGQTLDAYGYDPPALSANVGDTVTWTNSGTQAHTVTATDGSFDSGLVNPGGTFSLTLASAGTFMYTCTPHPWMKATLTVGGG